MRLQPSSLTMTPVHIKKIDIATKCKVFIFLKRPRNLFINWLLKHWYCDQVWSVYLLKVIINFIRGLILRILISKQSIAYVFYIHHRYLVHRILKKKDWFYHAKILQHFTNLLYWFYIFLWRLYFLKNVSGAIILVFSYRNDAFWKLT